MILNKLIFIQNYFKISKSVLNLYKIEFFIEYLKYLIIILIKMSLYKCLNFIQTLAI